jgi:hypothetical protein
VLAIALTGSPYLPAFVSAKQVFTQDLVVFALSDFEDFGVLSSAFHQLWAARMSSSMGDEPRYIHKDAFLTFPRPKVSTHTARVAESLDSHRKAVLARSQAAGSGEGGLTQLYTRVHDPACNDVDVVKLRELHKELDEAVAAAYGWDLDLRHGHYDTDRLGMRWTIHPDAWDEALDRLLALNQERAATQSTTPPDDTELTAEDSE